MGDKNLCFAQKAFAWNKYLRIRFSWHFISISFIKLLTNWLLLYSEMLVCAQAPISFHFSTNLMPPKSSACVIYAGASSYTSTQIQWFDQCYSCAMCTASHRIHYICYYYMTRIYVHCRWFCNVYTTQRTWTHSVPHLNCNNSFA